jgi:hypothetical protein
LDGITIRKCLQCRPEWRAGRRCRSAGPLPTSARAGLAECPTSSAHVRRSGSTPPTGEGASLSVAPLPGSRSIGQTARGRSRASDPRGPRRRLCGNHGGGPEIVGTDNEGGPMSLTSEDVDRLNAANDDVQCRECCHIMEHHASSRRHCEMCGSTDLRYTDTLGAANEGFDTPPWRTTPKHPPPPRRKP